MKGINQSVEILEASLRLFFRYPKLLVPLIFTWIIYASVILVAVYKIDWDALPQLTGYLLAFTIFLILSFSLVLSCSVLLEMIQQQEIGNKLNFSAALKTTFTQNFAALAPIAIYWAILWFIIALLTSKKRKDDDDSDNKRELNAENAAKTLGGYSESNGSIGQLFVQLLDKGVRMVVYLIIPAVAWENKGSHAAIRRGLTILKQHKVAFVTSIGLSQGFSWLIFLPSSLVIVFAEKSEIILPDYIWYILIMYIGFAWSYSMYIEQMFAAQLYLWHMRWENLSAKAKAAGKPLPSFGEVPRPVLFDEVKDLVKDTVK